ncbi:DeoR/GlpR family DNA-binding transcription regulator [Pararoseomonas indoligenes]|uniref:DeoR/GlpR transcriptional regulator n=1 Tax=Roseomonas indoligenes TaxID=2820811 RepID=A0A940N4Y8_9PROT|nr:DeoR/GlpR family DNA-binding transcription regulator [Pararoseomonas indoligenes]MBP0495245.1 DeoR/GlpR transcriptional regulator [Pararoseomonas indoligenes]
MNRPTFHMNIGVASQGRQAMIAEMLKTRDFLRVDELAQHFDVTTQTIRRDINGLCEQGVARRLHGGITCPSNSGGNMSFGDRQVMNRAAKRQIGMAVARHVPDGACVSLGIGTTPQVVAECLSGHRGLKIVTNNLPLALAAAQNPEFEVAIAGGAVRTGDLDVCGPAGEELFGAYRVDIAVFGVGGVDADGSLLDYSREEVRIREVMMRHARRTFLVLDASKFGRPAHVRGGRIEDVSAVFCDAELPPAIRDRLAHSDTAIVQCPPLLAGDPAHP